jgi:Xaa-Pro aminopeptidase
VEVYSHLWRKVQVVSYGWAELRKSPGATAEKFREAGIDGLLVTGQANVRYLTGFTGDSSWLLVLSGHPPVLLSDTRYETQLADECPGLAVEIRDAGGTLPRLFAKLAEAARVRRVGFEADHVTVSMLRQLESSLAAGGPGAPVLADTVGLVERLREVKDKFELAEIREAIRIAERGFAVVAQFAARQSDGDRNPVFAGVCDAGLWWIGHGV